jgi:hypothetical protein
MVLDRCPNDAAPISQVAEVVVKDEPVRFLWCKFCMELFAVVGQPGRPAAGFAADGRGGFRLFRIIGSEPDVQIAVAAVAVVELPCQ